MKRSTLRRKSPLKPSKQGVKRSHPPKRKALPKVNAERLRKRRKAYAAKLAKSRKSDGYRMAMLRAEGRCEYMRRVGTDPRVGLGLWSERCTVTEGLHAHHLTYARLGGDELPSDYQILCKAHHALIEMQQFPHRNRGAA